LTMLPVLDYTSSSGRMIVEFERIWKEDHGLLEILSRSLSRSTE
jgi:hypothetical protein